MISVIILTWNSEHYIERAIRSLNDDVHNMGIDIEILVVDGGSFDRTREILCRLVKEITRLQPILLKRNLGTTISRNIAIRKSHGDYLLFIDADTEILPGALNELLKALRNNPRAGISAPRLFYSNGMVQPSCKRFPNLIIKFCKVSPIPFMQKLGEKCELYPPEIYNRQFKKIIRVDHCISACWLVRREALKDVGLFDEQIFYAPEDVDYCLRMWLHGWEVLYVSIAEVLHYAQRKSRRDLSLALKHIKGLFYYFNKHKYYLNRKYLYYRIKEKSKQYGIQPPIYI